MTSIVSINIKRLLKEKGLKQKAIAEKLGINEKAFSALVNGNKIIRAEFIPSIASVLNVTPNDLFQPHQKSA